MSGYALLLSGKKDQYFGFFNDSINNAQETNTQNHWQSECVIDENINYIENSGNYFVVPNSNRTEPSVAVIVFYRKDFNFMSEISLNLFSHTFWEIVL